ncbi:amidase, partial [Corynebacterium stationis]
MSYVVPAEGLTSLSAAELAEKIHSREVTSREVVQAHLDRIAETNDALNSFLHVGAEEALATADAVDKALDAGEKPASALAGVPLALKDLLTTTDAPTTAASKMLEGWISPYDATVTKKLREAGIPILGKTNLDEFAMGSSNENSAYGPVHNPHDLERTPGGSGGGTSAALASGQAPLGIGTDTGGSIRQPA